MREQFIGLRKYIEHSHDGLSKRLDKIEVRLEKAGQQRLETTFERLEQKLDAGFSRLGRKIDALASARRRVTPRRS